MRVWSRLLADPPVGLGCPEFVLRGTAAIQEGQSLLVCLNVIGSLQWWEPCAVLLSRNEDTNLQPLNSKLVELVVPEGVCQWLDLGRQSTVGDRMAV